jgi:hypothetical protein
LWRAAAAEKLRGQRHAKEAASAESLQPATDTMTDNDNSLSASEQLAGLREG